MVQRKSNGLPGLKKETYTKMLGLLETELRDFGRPPKLSRADQLLMTLMYWREYHTQFHISETYGISEATVCRVKGKKINERALLFSVGLSQQAVKIEEAGPN